MKSNQEPQLRKIKGGWAARGNGWAVHAKTKEEAISKYGEHKRLREDIAKLPLWYLNPENPEYNQPNE